MPYRYLSDPLFLACFSAYWVNWWMEQCGVSPSLARCYLNDLVCIPFWVPIMLWIQRRLGLRIDDEIPRPFEIVIPLVLWSLVFEVILPSIPAWSGRAVADVNDVICYGFGAVVASRFWQWWYTSP